MNRLDKPTLLGLACLLAIGVPASAQIIYVDAAATDSANDGTTWCSAYLTLYKALTLDLHAGQVYCSFSDFSNLGTEIVSRFALDG